MESLSKRNLVLVTGTILTIIGIFYTKFRYSSLLEGGERVTTWTSNFSEGYWILAVLGLVFLIYGTFLIKQSKR